MSTREERARRYRANLVCDVTGGDHQCVLADGHQLLDADSAIASPTHECDCGVTW